jgi:replicative superfamily II helicase
MRTIRSVEQGMGRSVRGEKDYSVIIAIGSDLVRLLRDKASRKYLSSQMATQIEIGLEITELAKKDIEDGRPSIDVLMDLIRQCLNRDPDWKAYYVEEMGTVVPKGANETLLNLYAAELSAEEAYIGGDYASASELLQKLLDAGDVNADDKAWYLQQRARYHYLSDRQESQRLQVAAYSKNKFLLKPSSGISVAKLQVISQGRVGRISDWVKQFGSYTDLDIAVTDILSRFVFGTKADKFESALNELSRALGFAGERPDKEWKEGPDNLWALDDTTYCLFECKSEVGITRVEINKREAEQMNRSCAWFEKHYPGLKAKSIIIHPSNKVESAASFTHKVEAMRESELKQFVKACRAFFKAFETQNFNDLSAAHIHKTLQSHKLTVDDILGMYSKKLRDMK